MISAELLAASAGIITALCAGVAGLIGGLAALIVAFRQAQSQARKDKAEVKKIEVEADIEGRKSGLMIRKDEMDLLRGELARQYAVIENADRREKDRLTEIDTWRKRLADCQDSESDTLRKLDTTQDALSDAHKSNADNETLTRFLIGRERLFRQALADANISMPVMRRPGDIELLARINQMIEVMEPNGGPSSDSGRTDQTQA